MQKNKVGGGGGGQVQGGCEWRKKIVRIALGSEGEREEVKLL